MGEYTRLNYRPTVASDTHDILDANAINSAATAYRQRMLDLIAAGVGPDDYIPDDNNDPKRTHNSNGVRIHLDPPNFMTRTTIQMVDWLCQGLIAASTNTSVTPLSGDRSFVEESRVTYAFWKSSLMDLWIPVANVALTKASGGEETFVA